VFIVFIAQDEKKVLVVAKLADISKKVFNKIV